MSVVLVVGPPSSGKRALVQALVRSLDPDRARLASGLDAAPPAAVSSACCGEGDVSTSVLPASAATATGGTATVVAAATATTAAATAAAAITATAATATATGTTASTTATTTATTAATIITEESSINTINTTTNAAVVLPDRQVEIEQAAAVFDAYSVTIATKYYKAQVAFWRQAQQSAPILALRSVELKGLEGIIVVFDLGQENSWEEAEQWAAFLDGKEDCSFRVCVGSKVDLVPEEGGEGGNDPRFEVGTLSDSVNGENAATAAAVATAAAAAATAAAAAEGLQDRRRRCLEWCLDHGFEFVEADCRSAEKGGGLREKEGVPRVLEALQSNVWTGMDFCTGYRPSSLTATAIATAAAAATSSHRTNSGSEDSGGQIGFGSASNGGGIAEEGEEEEEEEEEVSEFLEGFIGADGYGGDAAAGYGALNSSDEDDGDDRGDGDDGDGDGDDRGDGDGDGDCGVDGGEKEDSSDKNDGGHDAAPSNKATDSGYFALGGGGEAERGRKHGDIHINGGGGEGIGGGHPWGEGDPLERRRGDAACRVDPGHVELQSRWEQSGPSSDAKKYAAQPRDDVVVTVVGGNDRTTDDGGFTATKRKNIIAESGGARSEGEAGAAEPISDREKAPLHGNDKHPSSSANPSNNVAPLPSDGEPAKACLEPEGGFQGEPVVGREEKTEEGKGEVSKSEEELLEATGAVFRGLGGDGDTFEMERLMGEVRKARELGGNVPDEERRSRAADVAMRLAALLGDDGDDYDDDSSCFSGED